MEHYNQIIKRSVDALLTDSSGSDLTKEMALNAVQERISRRGRPPGFEGHAYRAVKVVSDACNGVTVNCKYQENNPVRAIDGTCNNIANGLWGSMNIQMRRFLVNDYQDGRSIPVGEPVAQQNRIGWWNWNGLFGAGSGPKTGNHPIRVRGQCVNNPRENLPNPRVVSRIFHRPTSLPSNIATHFVAIMGQFLDHDITLTPEAEIHGCCEGFTDENCFPISVNGDSFYSQNGVSCLEFSRSLDFCSQEPREQINSITAFVDASNVYGSDIETAVTLRSFQGGKLKSTATGDYETLPFIDGSLMAGDVRAIENPALASLHTLFVREHNRIASQMVGTDASIFRRTRRIVIAEMQNVVYGQFLPAILGSASPSISSPTTYDSSIDPSIRNSFATAAFRFGHSMIQGLVDMVNEQTGQVEEEYALMDNFFNTSRYFAYSGSGAEKIIAGLMNQKAQTTDQFVIQDVTNNLFKEEGAPFGSDLVARNIQRGRDHGLPSYNAFRVMCGQSEICKWTERPTNIPTDQWSGLQATFENPNDIDLFTGGLAETLEPNAVTGKTFQCIMEKQFRALLNGDRHFFTHSNIPFKWSGRQINNIKTRTLAQIICDNTRISSVRSNVFLATSSPIPCPSSSTLDLGLFKEKPSFF